MHGSANRSVVIVSGLLTLLLLCGATLALALHNGWLRTGADAPVADTLSAQAPPAADGAQDEVAAYRTKLEDAYRALDNAYVQVQTLQSAQSADAPLARRGDRVERREHDDDDGPRERTVGRQRSERH